jgi:hypothetical protein
MDDCLDPVGMFEAFAASAERLDAWHAGGRRGARPPGRLRRVPIPRLGPLHKRLAAVPLDTVHDPDGRPPALRGTDEY